MTLRRWLAGGDGARPVRQHLRRDRWHRGMGGSDRLPAHLGHVPFDSGGTGTYDGNVVP